MSSRGRRRRRSEEEEEEEDEEDDDDFLNKFEGLSELQSNVQDTHEELTEFEREMRKLEKSRKKKQRRAKQNAALENEIDSLEKETVEQKQQREKNQQRIKERKEQTETSRQRFHEDAVRWPDNELRNVPAVTDEEMADISKYRRIAFQSTPVFEPVVLDGETDVPPFEELIGYLVAYHVDVPGYVEEQKQGAAAAPVSFEASVFRLKMVLDMIDQWLRRTKPAPPTDDVTVEQLCAVFQVSLKLTADQLNMQNTIYQYADSLGDAIMSLYVKKVGAVCEKTADAELGALAVDREHVKPFVRCVTSKETLARFENRAALLRLPMFARSLFSRAVRLWSAFALVEEHIGVPEPGEVSPTASKLTEMLKHHRMKPEKDEGAMRDVTAALRALTHCSLELLSVKDQHTASEAFLEALHEYDGELILKEPTHQNAKSLIATVVLQFSCMGYQTTS